MPNCLGLHLPAYYDYRRIWQYFGILDFGSTSCMVHDYVPTTYKASEPEQVATSDLERSYDL